MWISALLGMCTKFAEVTLSIKYRQRNQEGDWVGGPMYYIEHGLGKNFKWLAGMELSLAWAIADTLNGLMAIPNLIALAFLSPVVIKLSKDYFGSVKAGT